MWQSNLSTALALAALSFAATPAQAICGNAVPNVETSVSSILGGTSWHYDVYAQGQLSTCNQIPGQALTDYYLPYFSDMGITNVNTAAGWTFAIEAGNDRFGLGGGVMHFSTAARPASVTFSNLSTTASFDAAYGGTKGPFLVSTYDPVTGAVSNVLGDPDIPGSPLTLAALQPVPEPASALLMTVGLAALLGIRRRYR